MPLRRRSRSINSSSSTQVVATTVNIDGNNNSNKSSTPASSSALFTSPRLLHSSSLPSSCTKNPILDPEMSYAMSPTSVLDAAAAFTGNSDSKRRPWCDGAGLHGLADALEFSSECPDQKRSVLASQVKVQVPLIRSSSLDRRMEFGVKNRSSWLPLHGNGNGNAAVMVQGEIMELSSEDYTCVISRGSNPRTLHIFGDRVVEGSDDRLVVAARDQESSPHMINTPRRDARGFLSL